MSEHSIPNMEPQVKFAAATDFPQDIVALGKLCSDLATQVSSKLSETGHPQPSFAADGPSVFPILDQDFENKRNQLREASKMLYELTTNPEDLVTRELWAKVIQTHSFFFYRNDIHSAFALANSASQRFMTSTLFPT